MLYTQVGFISCSLSFGVLCILNWIRVCSLVVLSPLLLSLPLMLLLCMMSVNCKYYASNLIVSLRWKNFQVTFDEVDASGKNCEQQLKLKEEEKKTHGLSVRRKCRCTHDFFIGFVCLQHSSKFVDFFFRCVRYTMWGRSECPSWQQNAAIPTKCQIGMFLVATPKIHSLRSAHDISSCACTKLCHVT